MHLGAGLEHPLRVTESMEDEQRAARLARMRGGGKSRRSRFGAAPSPIEPRRRPSVAKSDASLSVAAPSPTHASERRMSTNLSDSWKLPARSELSAEEPPPFGVRDATPNTAAIQTPRDEVSTADDSQGQLAALLSHRFASPEALEPETAQKPEPELMLQPMQPAHAPAPRQLTILPATPAPVPAASQFRPANASESRRQSVQELVEPPPSPLVTTSSMVTELMKLRQLSREGAITDQDMSAARQQLLRRSTFTASPRPQPNGFSPATSAPLATSSQPVVGFSSTTMSIMGAKFAKPSPADTLLSKLHRDAEQKVSPTQALLQKLENDMRGAYTTRAPSQIVHAARAIPGTSSHGSALKLSLAPTDTPRPTANTWHGTAHLKQATSSAPAVPDSAAVGITFGQPSPRGEDDDATRLLRRLEGDIVALGASRSSHRVRCTRTAVVTSHCPHLL